MIYPIILSGGVGKRLWPVSSQSNPKQFQKLFNDQSLLQNTYQRMISGFAKDNIFVVSNIDSLGNIKSQIDIKEANLVLEPERKGTAMAIGIAAIKIFSIDQDAVVVNINSDSYVKEVNKYLAIIKQAAKVAEQEEKMVLIGVEPSYPEIAYGYIEADQKIDKNVFAVKSFKEKPDRKTAEQYIKDKFLWNPTLLVFPAKKLLEWYKEFLPATYDALIKIKESNFKKEIIIQEYKNVENISIDYGLLEKMNGMLLMPTDITWSDIGNWRSLRDIVAKNKKDNVSNVKNISIDSKNNLFYSNSDKLIASIGVEDMILVETADVIFLCPADKAQEVKLLLEKMKKENLDKYL
ncbi:MAG: sugar phosphate nucleotidyltransferase [Patescibacteria group bacterium]|jgi:mannose-1-phosphate guanylyltransferase